MIEDHYGTLGLRRNATADEIRQAYRLLARKTHPDNNPYDPNAAEKFRVVKDAYDILSSSERRREYDQSLPPEHFFDLEKFTSLDEESLLPPQLSLSAVDFGSIEQGDSSISQVVVTVVNANDERSLRPVLKSKKGAFWRTQEIGTDPYQFAVSMHLPELLESGTYTGKVKVYWEGFPDKATRLRISLTVEPVADSAVTRATPKPRSSRPSNHRPARSTSSNARVQAAMSPDREVGAGLLWLLFAAVNIAGPMAVMYWVIGGFTATVSGGGSYVVAGPLCFLWLLFGATNCVKMAVKSFRGH